MIKRTSRYGQQQAATNERSDASHRYFLIQNVFIFSYDEFLLFVVFELPAHGFG